VVLVVVAAKCVCTPECAACCMWSLWFGLCLLCASAPLLLSSVYLLLSPPYLRCHTGSDSLFPYLFTPSSKAVPCPNKRLYAYLRPLDWTAVSFAFSFD
jgi:hypothetical protein